MNAASSIVTQLARGNTIDAQHVDTQFTGLIDRNWSPIERDALVASIWETPESTEAERALSARCEEWNAGAALWSDDAKPTGNGRRYSPKHRKQRAKRSTFLPVIRYLRGDFDA